MRLAAGVVVALVCASGTARAQRNPPVTSRDFAIDLYTGAALGSVRSVGMGGTAVAVSEGTVGAVANPAAAAVRLTTSKGSWDYDWHLDALRAIYATDLDNDGYEDEDAFGSRLTSFGIAGMLHGWGLAIVGTASSAELEGESGDTLQASALTTKIALAKELFDQEWTVGLAIRYGTFALDEAGPRREPVFSLGGAGLEGGVLWRPPMRSWRAGAALSFPILGDDPSIEGCDPNDCDGYILPDRVVAPWQLAAGVSWRRAPSVWNQHVNAEWRDEHVVLLAMDVVVTGKVPDGYGIQAWAHQELQPSGRHVSVSLRAGVEWECIPSRLRVRGGSYWEPGRFESSEGRIHLTFGAEVSVVQIRFFTWWYRIRLSATGDVAEKYGNAGLSVGFWH